MPKQKSLRKVFFTAKVFVVFVLVAFNNVVYAVEPSTLRSPSNGFSTTDTTPNFSWYAATGAAYYTVQVGTDPTLANPAAPRWVKRDLTGLSYSWNTSFIPNATAGSTPSQLEIGQKYYWRIKSMDAPTFEPGMQAAFSSIRSFSIKPDRPVVTLDSTSATGSYSMSWSEPLGDITEYKIREIGPSGTVYYYQSSTEKSFSGKAPGSYSYRIRACVGSVCSSYSSTKTITVDEPLGAATPLTPTEGEEVLSDELCFTWGAATSAEYYTIQVSSDTNFNADSMRWVNADIDASETSVCWGSGFVANPTAGSTPEELPTGIYYWRVKTLDSLTAIAGTSTFSEMRSIQIKEPLGIATPLTPLDNAEAINDSLCFTWGAATNAAYYTLQIGTDPILMNPAELRWVNRDIPNDTFSTCWGSQFIPNDTAGSTPSELPPGTYYWRVKALDSHTDIPGISTFSEIRSIQIEEPLGTAVPLTPLDNAEAINDSLCFTWGAATSAEYYTLQIGTDPTLMTPSELRWVDRDIPNDTLSTCWGSQFIPNETAGSTPEFLPAGTYYWRVKSLDSLTEIPGTATFSEILTLSLGAGNTVTGLAAEYSSYPHGLKLSWNTFPGTTTYEIARSIDSGVTWDYSYGSTSEPEFIDSDIDYTSLTYSYRVRACSATCSNWTANPHQ